MRRNHLTEFMNRSYGKRRIKNIAACLILALSAVVALSLLFLVFGYVLAKGIPALNVPFFTALPKPVGEPGGGMANAIVGTFTLVALASFIGIPWGVFTGLYLSEYGQGRLGTAVRFASDMLSSVPSIVIGLFAYVIVVKPMHRFSAWAGAIALSILMIPTIARNTEELLKLVPVHIREAGLALGIPRWKVTLRVVLRGAVSGILTGVILSVARIAGETAPLLFTALNNRFWQHGLDQPVASLPVQIYTYAVAPFEDWNRQAWAGALILVLFVFALNLVTRSILRPSVSVRD